MSKARNIKTILETAEDKELFSIQLKSGRQIIHWEDMSRSEQFMVLNTLAQAYNELLGFVKRNDDENTNGKESSQGVSD